MAKHKINPREINSLLNQEHVDAFVQAYQQAFGEHASIAYTRQEGQYAPKQDSKLLELLKKSPYFSKLSEQVQNSLGDSPVDFFGKDLAMMVLQPIGLAIEGSLQTIIGLVQMMSHIPAVLNNEDKDDQMHLAMSKTWLGVSILLLAAVAPLARMFHAATRAYASVTDPKNEDQDLTQGFKGVDLFSDNVDKEYLDLLNKQNFDWDDDLDNASEYSDDESYDERAGLVAYITRGYKEEAAKIRTENTEEHHTDEKKNIP
ncbi:MAG: hypothetical protein P1U36_03685 [Legionellaceae bacterium]|nr:hypothetical protein [Legionellaceae bacterium]